MGNTTEGNFTAMIYSRERREETILLEEATLIKRSSLEDSSQHDLYSDRERERAVELSHRGRGRRRSGAREGEAQSVRPRGLERWVRHV